MANFDVELNDEVENFTVEFGEVQRITVDDFDKLRNRPSYAGQTMTHETNIPEVPTAVSQLTNDADYQTGSEVESAISTAVGGEKDAREQADAGLSRDIGVVDGKVDAEADARERADIALQGAIDDEETARKNADNGLQGQIDAITSSSDVVDIVGTYAELLQYPTAGLGDKDVIKVLQDETHNDAMSYYRWNKSSSTWSYIGSEGPYYTKSETNTLLGDKQDTLTAGSNVTISSNNTISATDTTYTAGNGLTLTGTEFSADTTVLQPKLTAGDGINISAQNVISANIDPADFFTASETVDGTGSEMTLNNTIQAKIKSVQMDGDTFQQTYSGKNLIDSTNLSYVFSNSPTQIELSSISNGIRMVNNGGASQDRFAVFRSVDLTPYIGKVVRMKATFGANGGIRLYRIASDGSNRSQMAFATVSDTEISFTVPSDLGASPYLGYVLDVTVGGGTTVDFTNLIMTIDESLEPFEPYTGGIPAPNPDYPQPIQVVTGEQTVMITGKNLLDSLNGYVDGYINNSGGIGAGGGANALFDYIPVSPSIRYTLSQYDSTVGNVGIAYFDSDKTFISREQTYSFTTHTYTMPSNCAYVRIWVYKAGGISQNILEQARLQFQIGSTATPYKPYHGQSYTIDLGSTEFCKLGTYQDNIYKSGDDWYVHKACEKVVFDGTEDWLRNDVNEVFTLSNVVPYLADGTAPYSDYFKGQANVSSYARMENNNVGLLQSDTSNRTIFKYTAITSASAFKTWLSSHNTTVYYPLATPTDTQITDATLISELNALADALGYKDKTIITVSATGTNLPAILEVSAYRNSLAGVLGVIGRAEAA